MQPCSIRLQLIVMIALLMIIPVMIVGSAGILYYRDVLRQDLWDNNLGQAKAISALTDNYMDHAQTYLISVADRPLVIKAVEDQDRPFLNYTTKYVSVQSDLFGRVFIADSSGMVLSSYPYSDLIDRSYIDRPCIVAVLNNSTPYISDAVKSDISGKPTVYISSPIINSNNSTIGVLVGEVDLTHFNNVVQSTEIKNERFTYLVNQSGHVMVHSNSSYMDNMTDFSALPTVNNVTRMREGVEEQYFPFENDIRLAAYSPVKAYGWGVIVALPLSIAYQPIAETTWFFISVLILLLIISIVLAYLLGNYIAGPLVRIDSATTKILDGDPATLEQSLPLKRKDEIGHLARSVISMAKTIRSDREHIISARNRAEIEKERAEEEKLRAELYVDIMGHDINNLNQSILANLETIQMGDNLTDDQKRMISSAITSVMSSAGIIDNVRKLQKITGEELHIEKVDIDPMIQECIKEAHRPEGKKVVIRYTAKKGLYIVGTPLLKEVFCNLIDNSMKYSGDEVEIDIQVMEKQLAGRRVYEVAVSDNGYGIPDEFKPKLFQRFQRGTTKAHGKGLGLYIVKKLLEKFGGSIQIRDRIPGDHTQGSTFVITLTAAEG